MLHQRNPKLLASKCQKKKKRNQVSDDQASVAPDHLESVDISRGKNEKMSAVVAALDFFVASFEHFFGLLLQEARFVYHFLQFFSSSTCFITLVFLLSSTMEGFMSFFWICCTYGLYFVVKATSTVSQAIVFDNTVFFFH